MRAFVHSRVFVRACARVFVCVCVCVCARARARACLSVCLFVSASLSLSLSVSLSPSPLSLSLSLSVSLPDCLSLCPFLTLFHVSVSKMSGLPTNLHSIYTEKNIQFPNPPPPPSLQFQVKRRKGKENKEATKRH